MQKRQLGEWIKHLRELLGWSQRDLAEKSGVDQSRLSRFENGVRPLNTDEMENIANAFGLTLPQLMDVDHEVRAIQKIEYVESKN